MNKLYYALLIFSLVIGLVQIITFEYQPQNSSFDFLLQIWSVLVFIVLFWSKKEFVGTNWLLQTRFEKSLTAKAKPVFDEAKHIATLPNASEREVHAYTQLAKLCCTKENQPALTLLFNNLKDFTDDEVYLTTLNYIIDKCDDEQIFFIWALDWSETVENLIGFLQDSLKQNFKLDITLPYVTESSNQMLVDSEHRIKDINKILATHGLQCGFINTMSDEYVAFIHPTNDLNTIKNLIQDIGYQYLEI